MMTDHDEDERRCKWRSHLERYLDKLEVSMLVQHENGITCFENAKGYYDTAHEKLKDAHKEIQKSLSDFDYAQVDKLTREAQMEFDKSINAAPLWWRWTYVHGYLYIFLYFLLILGVLLGFFAWPYADKMPMINVPIWALLFGIVGGALRGILWVREHSTTYTIRKSWVTYLVVPPFIGAVLGIIAYQLHDLLHAEAGAMLFSLVGGYSSEFVFRHLNHIFGTE